MFVGILNIQDLTFGWIKSKTTNMVIGHSHFDTNNEITVTATIMPSMVIITDFMVWYRLLNAL